MPPRIIIMRIIGIMDCIILPMSPPIMAPVPGAPGAPIGMPPGIGAIGAAGGVCDCATPIEPARIAAVSRVRIIVMVVSSGLIVLR